MRRCCEHGAPCCAVLCHAVLQCAAPAACLVLCVSSHRAVISPNLWLLLCSWWWWRLLSTPPTARRTATKSAGRTASPLHTQPLPAATSRCAVNFWGRHVLCWVTLRQRMRFAAKVNAHNRSPHTATAEKQTLNPACTALSPSPRSAPACLPSMACSWLTWLTRWAATCGTTCPRHVGSAALRCAALCCGELSCSVVRSAFPTNRRCTARSSALQGSHALYNEQLVYVAAFAVGARLVFGDRPKQITYSRMLWMPSIGAWGWWAVPWVHHWLLPSLHAGSGCAAHQPTHQPLLPSPGLAVDLDEAYGTMSSANYADLVSQAPQRRPAASASATESALLGERDAVMLSALHMAAMQRWAAGLLPVCNEGKGRGQAGQQT